MKNNQAVLHFEILNPHFLKQKIVIYYSIRRHCPQKHKKTNFNWWRKRFKRQLALVDFLRLDHFRGLAGYWRVNGNSKSAICGKWINSPGRTLLNKLKKDFRDDYLPIIAEDLGVITPDVEKLR